MKNIRKTLSSLLYSIPVSYEIHGECDKVVIESVEYDSRKVKDGSVFFCLRGAAVDGHDYAARAYILGCRVFAVEKILDLPGDAVQIVFPNTREALAYVSAQFYGRPAEKMKIIGITGTKGKTTTAFLIKNIFTHHGIKCGYIGTNGCEYGSEHLPTVNSTPESCELHRFFSLMVDYGCEYAVIEVSSQALDNYRVKGIRFDTVIFTNLSRDHIGAGEHSSFEEYREAKHKLFRDYGAGHIIYNANDKNAAYMLENHTPGAELIGYGVGNPCEFSGEGVRSYMDKTSLGIEFDMVRGGVKTGMRLRTPGLFSVYNALAAAAAVSVYGMSAREASDALAVISIPGRSEIVSAVDGVTFVIDYAHNGVSLTDELTVLRSYNPRRLICVFGCIGGRTFERRRELAEAASSLADFTVITSDNPNNEDPEVIIRDVLQYFDTSKPYTTIADREEAVRFAVRIANEGDFVLFAGKGHEDYQLVHGEKVPFCERAIILDEAQKLSAAQTVN